MSASTSALAPIAALRAAFDTFLGYGWRRHLLALGILWAATWTAYGFQLIEPEPWVDEAIYLEAFEDLSAGRDVYAPGSGFLYPPVFAYLGAALFEAFGTLGTLAIVRLGNSLAIPAISWLAVAALPFSWRLRVLVGTALVGLVPGYELALVTGNVSPIIVALSLFALMAWPRHPVAAGLALGTSIGFKPLVPGAGLVLGTRRSAPPSSRAFWTAAIGGVTAVGLLFGPPGLGDMLQLSTRAGLGTARPVSLLRSLQALGFDPSRLALFVGVAVLLLLVVRALGRLDALNTLWVAIAAAVWLAPILWSHSLTLVLPLQIAACWVAWTRLDGLRHGGGEDPSTTQAPRAEHLRRQRLETACVTLIAASLFAANAADGTTGQHPLLEAFAFGLPILTPTLLAGYLLVLGRTESRHSDKNGPGSGSLGRGSAFAPSEASA